MVCTFESCAGLMILLVCFVVLVVGETVLLMEAASFVIAVADSWFVGSTIDSDFETLVSSIFSFLTASTGCSSFETCSGFELTFVQKNCVID